VPTCQQIWVKPLTSGQRAVNFVNFDTKNVTVACDASCLTKMGFANGQQISVRDVWQHKDLGTFSSFNATLGPDGASATYIFSKA
jgi:hypothetical protein